MKPAVGRPKVGRKRIVTIRVPEEIAALYDAVARRRHVWHTDIYLEKVIEAAASLAADNGHEGEET